MKLLEPHRVGIRFSPFVEHNNLPLYDEETATHLYLTRN